MVVNKAFKFRLYPTPEQAQCLAQQFGASRFVYNYFLRQRIDYYAAHRGEKKPGLTYHDTARLLTELKHQPETAWLKDANSQALQAALRNLDTAYNNFFNKRTEFPKFKSKRDKQSFHVPQHFALDREHSRLILPKLTPIKIVLHRPLEGEIKSITISRAPTGRHFAVILCEAEITPKPKKTGRIIGVDLGLKSFAVTSDGEKVDPPQHLRKAGAKLAILQRRMARKQRGSKNREKTQLKVARLHEKVANQRADFLHKLSRHLIDESQAIYVEDLNVKGMLANRHLAKSISDSSWSEFVRQLDYKGTWYGCQVRTIDRFFPSSKRHALCGYIYQDLRLSEREWTCPECGQVVDRDANAAQNILLFGQLTHCKIISRRAGTVLTSTPGETAARKGGHGTRKPPASGW